VGRKREKSKTKRATMKKSEWTGKDPVPYPDFSEKVKRNLRLPWGKEGGEGLFQKRTKKQKTGDCQKSDYGTSQGTKGGPFKKNSAKQKKQYQLQGNKGGKDTNQLVGN